MMISKIAERIAGPTLWLSAVVVAFPIIVTNAKALELSKPKGVVELFTSQGCSSCPPADAILKEINQGDEILGLALHVDYWDRLGWADTFASPANTDRQWRYARALGERQVYTPQAIINGRTHVVGSQRAKILDTVSGLANKSQGLYVDVNLEKVGNVVKLSIPASNQSQNATLYAFYYNPEATVKIERGENAAKTITYSNIVGKIEMIGMVGADGMNVDFAIADMTQDGYKSCAMILQSKSADGGPGPIIGAAVMSEF